MDEKRKTYQKDYRSKYKSQAHRVNLTLSRNEYRRFKRAADTEKLKVTSFIKTIALSALDNQAYIPEEINTELRTLRFAILNIANNVNQIAHHSNTIHKLTQADENNLLQHLKQLDEIVRSYTSGQILNNKQKQ